MDDKSRAEIISYILKGNEMMRRHAEERHRLLKQIINQINAMDTGKSDLVNKALKEAVTIQEEIEQLEIELASKSGQSTTEQEMLIHLNKRLKILDKNEDQRIKLVNKVMQADANLFARDELIGILQEYIDLEGAAVHRVLVELSESQTKIEDYSTQLETYEKISKHDPRFKALEVLYQHPQGISMTQLSFMLGISQYEAHKIINELINFGMINKRIDSEILQSSQLLVEETSSIIVENEFVKELQH